MVTQELSLWDSSGEILMAKGEIEAASLIAPQVVQLGGVYYRFDGVSRGIRNYRRIDEPMVLSTDDFKMQGSRQ